jgi:hypothetical protein
VFQRFSVFFFGGFMRSSCLSLLIGLLAISDAVAFMIRPFVGGSVSVWQSTAPPLPVNMTDKTGVSLPRFLSPDTDGINRYSGDVTAGLMTRNVAVYLSYRSRRSASASEGSESTNFYPPNYLHNLYRFDFRWSANQVALGVRLYPSPGGNLPFRPFVGAGMSYLQVKRTYLNLAQTRPTPSQSDYDSHAEYTAFHAAPILELGILVDTGIPVDIWLIGGACISSVHPPDVPNQSSWHYHYYQYSGSLGVTYCLKPI